MKIQCKTLLWKIVPLMIPLFVVLYGCENQSMKEQKEKEFEMIKALTTVDKDVIYREEAILLSMKYSVDEDKVFNLLVEKSESIGKLLRKFGDKDSEKIIDDIKKETRGLNTKNRLTAYSKKYDIPSNIIASILIDYKSMRRCDEI